MHLQYRETKDWVMCANKESGHVPPHLHDALEIVYVTEGSLEAGVGEELYHMEKGDMAFIFPHVIHHYQVFSNGTNRVFYMQIPSYICGAFMETLQKCKPRRPIISRAGMEDEVLSSLWELSSTGMKDMVVAQAYMQIILVKCLPMLEMTEKENMGSEDIIYKVASYIAANFRDEISLTSMASDLGVSKYVLSRVFSKMFRCNFNRYLNEARLHYACDRLGNTNRTITQVCMDSGFDSQRTFNRVFKERYRMTPREYRQEYRQEFC